MEGQLGGCQSVTFRFLNFSVSKLFQLLGWYRYRFRNFLVSKKYRYRFRKKLVSKKVSVSVSKNFGIEKSIGIGFEKNLVLKDMNLFQNNLVKKILNFKKSWTSFIINWFC